MKLIVCTLRCVVTSKFISNRIWNVETLCICFWSKWRLKFSNVWQRRFEHNHETIRWRWESLRENQSKWVKDRSQEVCYFLLTAVKFAREHCWRYCVDFELRQNVFCEMSCSREKSRWLRWLYMSQRKTKRDQNWFDLWLYRKSHVFEFISENMWTFCRYFRERQQTFSNVSRFRSKCIMSSTMMNRAKQIALLNMNTIISKSKSETFIDFDKSENRWMNSIFFCRFRDERFKSWFQMRQLTLRFRTMNKDHEQIRAIAIIVWTKHFFIVSKCENRNVWIYLECNNICLDC